MTSFVNLVKQLSRNKCNFANGLSCIQCSAIHLYLEIHFLGDMNKDSLCYFCKTPILPNFKCMGCINYCHCCDDNYRSRRDRCKGFCCNDCKISKQINRQTWRLPGCEDEEEQEEEGEED